MYETYYGLRERPFALLPDPDFLFLSQKHRTALALLEYSIVHQAGFCVITGGIGTGKTTLIRYLLNQLGPDVTTGLISNTHSSFGELLQWVLHAFGLERPSKDKIDLYQAFLDFMIKEYAARRRVVLIVDEAQNIDPPALEELRMLSNVNADKDLILQVILVGQKGLRDTLCRPELEQFAQRIAVDYHLTSLSFAETRAYVRHRLEVVGGDSDLFEDDAVLVIHRTSRGIPRLVNLLCDTALVYGYAEQQPRINARLAIEVGQDKQAGGIFPVQSREDRSMGQGSGLAGR